MEVDLTSFCTWCLSQAELDHFSCLVSCRECKTSCQDVLVLAGEMKYILVLLSL